MAIAAAIVIVPLGVLFFISGLVVNFVQEDKQEVAELLWLELVWLVDWWAGVKIELHTDSETFKLMGKEHALLICNHRSDIDWLVGWVLAQRSGCLGSALAVMKKSSKLLPGMVHCMKFDILSATYAMSSIFRISTAKGFPRPFWLALLLRVLASTQAKLLAAQEYASSTGLPVPRNVLIPRTKVHVHLKRHLMKDLPETDDAVAQWCKDAFVAKDKLLDKHAAEDSFGDEQQDIHRAVKSLLVVCSWAILLILGVLKVIQCFSLFSSWKGVAFSAVALAVVTILMQILIQFSQSERSTPAKVAPSKSRSEVGSTGTRQDKQQ
ncbi:hypothetical protein DH2020_041616 [Rehmannia glutinosa]|uniref:1-acylglycerol-3-phosphate O-acyltransferase n=1 Tax=Rehmannia glutinosa TaxID=99300 RepID=A0ABR0UPR3_REHGL